MLGKDNSLVITDDAKGKIKRIFKLLDIVTCIKDKDDKNHLILITPAYEEKEFKLGKQKYSFYYYSLLRIILLITIS